MGWLSKAFLHPLACRAGEQVCSPAWHLSSIFVLSQAEREVSQAWSSLPGSAKLVPDRWLTSPVSTPVADSHKVGLNLSTLCIGSPLLIDNARSIKKVWRENIPKDSWYTPWVLGPDICVCKLICFEGHVQMVEGWAVGKVLQSSCARGLSVKPRAREMCLVGVST